MELEVRVPPQSRSSEDGENTGVTEIYVPYVHYRASIPQVREARRPEVARQSKSTPMEKEFVDRLAQSAREQFFDIGETLALDIDVSEGSCKVVGQLLLWRYQYPAAGSPEKVVTMRLSRRGGAIPVVAK